MSADVPDLLQVPDKDIVFRREIWGGFCDLALGAALDPRSTVPS